jgi:hypothetical protein
MGKYTLGPWSTSPCSNGGRYLLRGKLGDHQHSVQIYPEDDAYLISAAPDLLEALEVIVERFSGYQGMMFVGARAAIAKAKGETND